MMEAERMLSLAEEAARLGGSVLMDWRGRFHVQEKGPADLVTEADLASQNAIADFLAREAPQVGFIGEESTSHSGTNAPTENDVWVVDPLDGTTNYVHDLPGWCVSIGLMQSGRLTLGCVFDPVSEACYTALEGQGAFCNGNAICTSDVDSLSQALVAISLATEVKRGSWEVERMIDMLSQAQAFRRLGSAALNLCHLAAGRLDGYWANSVKLWDVAAGLVILREAGGMDSDIEGGELDVVRPRLVAGCNGKVHKELLEILGRSPANSA